MPTAKTESHKKQESPGPNDELARRAMDFLEKLLLTHRRPGPPPELSAIEGFDSLLGHLGDLKEMLFQFSTGRFGGRLKRDGAVAGYIKALQSNIRHLAWQCHCVADGDLNQRVDFMGELTDAFNHMTASLAEQSRAISEKQEELAALTMELRREIKRKEEAEAVLRASEEAYRQKSLRDPLTGLYNRGFFYETATREMENLKRHAGSHACVVMIDIDRFKLYNDTYGHLLGDQAIKIVAATLAGALRKSDILARFGGEEFVMYLDDADLETGLNITERIRAQVEARPNPAGRQFPPVTVSLGLCCLESYLIFPDSDGQRILMEALGQADAALYEAKGNGRNQVRRAPGLQPKGAPAHTSPRDGKDREKGGQGPGAGRKPIAHSA